MSNNSCFPTKRRISLFSLLEITALIASLIPQECKQAIISSQEDNQDIKFKEGAIKCCKEKNTLPLVMSGITFHFVIGVLYFWVGNYAYSYSYTFWFQYFHHENDANFLTRFEEVLKIIDFGWIRYTSLSPFWWV